MRNSIDWSIARILAAEDVIKLKAKDDTYNESWKKRGGIGAFMMLARKWDRIENQTHIADYDAFKAWGDNPGPDGYADDINDLIRYLMILRLEMYVRTKEPLEWEQLTDENDGLPITHYGEATQYYTNQDGIL